MLLAGGLAQAHVDHGQSQFDKRAKWLLAYQNHLAPTQKNVELVSKLKLSDVVPGRVSDVGVHGKYAYLGDFEPKLCDSKGACGSSISPTRRSRARSST